MPFALYEYDAAFTRFFSQTMRVLAQAHSPLLAEMRFVETPGTIGSRVRDREGMDIVLDPGKTSTEITSDLKAVREGHYEQLYEAMYESADAMAEQLVGYFIESIGKVTEGTGNVLDAGGRPFGFDVLYETLENLEFSLDENDELVMPSLIMHPKNAEKLRDLPPLTDEQQRRLDALKERKRTEALARRRRRRLS
ncbi:MAG: hypothetical protein QOE06_3037 [Thermoleophilaceae bacterium]|jgi:hypothetical protein|nr:hypothetical protein [Thermoleophilaceae bacterium]